MQEWGTVDPAALAQDILNHPTVHSVKHKGLRNIINTNIDTWVRSAIKSKELVNKHEYFVKEGKVIKVDNKNTGAIQASMVLPNGIHQFIQVREGVEVTDENMTGGFSSVLAFFQLYNRKIGLTGTIGEVDDRREFDVCYSLNFFYIPPSSVSKRTDSTIVLASTSEEEWLSAVLSSARRESQQNQRPVLVISDSIRDAELIHSSLGDTCQLYTGIQSKDEDKILQDAGRPGTITSSTNLAGRGMDITTLSTSEKNGGMHVICTFLPINTRVEQQAAGRTARQGKKGTFLMIIKPSQSEVGKTQDQLKTKRNYIHSLRAKHKLQILIPAAQLAAKLFKSFCEVKDSFLSTHDLLEKNDSGENRIKDKNQEIHSMRERWMLFIGAFQKRFEFAFNPGFGTDRGSNLTIADFLQEQQKDFNVFKSDLEVDLKNGTSILSSIQYIAKVSSDVVKSFENNTELDVTTSIRDIESSFECADGPHPTAVLLHAFLKSRMPDVYSSKDVLRTLKKSLTLFVDWLDVTQFIQGVVPKDTRLKLLIDIIKDQVSSLRHVIVDVKSWMRTAHSSQNLSSVLQFTKNKQKIFQSKNAVNPLSMSNTNVIHLKRIGVTGKLESRLHDALFSDLNRNRLMSMGIKPHEGNKK